jgi:hypothetical protein
VARQPELISDGGGLPFPPTALLGAHQPLAEQDPAVEALHSHLAARAAKRSGRLPWKRGEASEPPSLEGWRLLAQTETEALFGIGRPPRLLTVTARREGIRRRWSCAGPNAAGTVRVTREGIRASSWRLDPTQETQPDQSTLRVLVTEQAFASGQRAEGRILPPDIYIDEKEIVLTMFVTPRPGYQSASKNPESAVRIALPDLIGHRPLVDGAFGGFAPPS